MNINQMKYFQTIAQTGSLTKSAEILFVSQSALSKMIKELEKELGCQLFIRTYRGFILSKYGKELFEIITPILDQFEMIPDKINKFTSKINNTLTMDSHYSMLYNILYNILGTNDENIKLDFKLSERPAAAMIDDVINCNLDCAFVCISDDELLKLKSYTAGTSVKFIYLLSDRFYLSVPKNDNIYNKPFISVNEINNDRIIRAVPMSYIEKKIEEMYANNKHAYEFKHAMELNSFLKIWHTLDYDFFTSSIYITSSDMANDFQSSRTNIIIDDPNAIMNAVFVYNNDKKNILFIKDKLIRDIYYSFTSYTNLLSDRKHKNI